MKCLHCRATHIRAVGPDDTIQYAARILAMKYHAACGHDHGDGGHDHGVVVVPGNNQFAYIRLPD